MQEATFSIPLQLPAFDVSKEKSISSSCFGEESIGNATSTTIGTLSSSLYSTSMDDLLLLEVSDRYVDISNLVSQPLTSSSFVNDFEKAVAIQSDEDEDNDDDDDDDDNNNNNNNGGDMFACNDYNGSSSGRDGRSKGLPCNNKSLPHISSSSMTQKIIYPDLKTIDDISELDVDEFLPKTCKIIKSYNSKTITHHDDHHTDNVEDDGLPSTMKSPSYHSRDPPATLTIGQEPEQQQFQPQPAPSRMMNERLQQHQIQNQSQRFSRRNLLSSQQTESQYLPLHGSQSSFYDSPSVDDNDMTVRNQHYHHSTSNRDLGGGGGFGNDLSSTTTSTIQQQQRQLESIHAIQKAISVRHHRDAGGFQSQQYPDNNKNSNKNIINNNNNNNNNNKNRDEGGWSNAQQQQQPQSQYPQHPHRSFNSHTLSSQDNEQQQQQQQQPPLSPYQHSHQQRLPLRSQESFKAHSLNYTNEDLGPYHQQMNNVGSFSSGSSRTSMDRRNSYTKHIATADRTPPSITNHHMVANEDIMNRYNQNNINDNMRQQHLHDSVACEEDELYDDFADGLNHHSRHYGVNPYHHDNYKNPGRAQQQFSNHNEPQIMIERNPIRPSYTEPTPQPKPVSFNYSNGQQFQMQRGGRYNQSERNLRTTPSSDLRYHPARVFNSGCDSFQQPPQTYSSSYRHVPLNHSSNNTPTTTSQQPSQHPEPTQNQNYRQYGLSQSYHVSNTYDNNNMYNVDPSTSFRKQASPSVTVPSSSSSTTTSTSSSYVSRCRAGGGPVQPVVVTPPLQLEISPGTFANVRGANETEYALMTNQLIHLQCMACTLYISCINDAEYVLCPMCKVIGPTNTTITNGIGGIGLGFQTER